MKNWIHLQVRNYKPKCESCGVIQYCGTMVSSIRLCRSVMEQKIIKEAMKKLFDIISITPHKNSTEGVSVVFKLDKDYYLADQADTFDYGWETMIFKCDKEGNVDSWMELYTDRTEKALLDCINEFAEEYFQDNLKQYIG